MSDNHWLAVVRYMIKVRAGFDPADVATGTTRPARQAKYIDRNQNTVAHAQQHAISHF